MGELLRRNLLRWELAASLALSRMTVMGWGVWAAPVEKGWLCPPCQAVRWTTGTLSNLRGGTYHHIYAYY